MKIVKAIESDNIVLTEVTKMSKAFWGYSSHQLKQWENELTITAKYIADSEVFNLEVDNQIVAYYSFIKISNNHVKLDNLFVLPDFIGKKYGTFLLEDFLSRVCEKGFTKVSLDAEPNSEKFYQQFGFVTVSKKESSIRNRFLPIMEMSLA